MENKKNIIIVLVLVVVLTVVGYFLLGRRNTVENRRVVESQQNVGSSPSTLEKDVKEFTLTAKKWEFNPSIIKVKIGDKVRLRVISIDVDHGLAIPEFGVNIILKPNKLSTAEFIADKKGEFTFFVPFTAELVIWIGKENLLLNSFIKRGVLFQSRGFIFWGSPILFFGFWSFFLVVVFSGPRPICGYWRRNGLRSFISIIAGIGSGLLFRFFFIRSLLF